VGERLTIKFDNTLGQTETAAIVAEQEHDMRKVIRGYAKDKNLNLFLIGTIPVPYSKDKRSPAARQDKRYLIRQGATIYKKETIR